MGVPRVVSFGAQQVLVRGFDHRLPPIQMGNHDNAGTAVLDPYKKYIIAWMAAAVPDVIPVRETDLSGADHRGAYLYPTRISGADLSAVKGLTDTQLQIACGDATTKLPSGLKAPSRWPCPEP